MEFAFKLAVILFMAGSLLQLGLVVTLADAVTSLRDWRFLGVAFAFAFLVGPALAWGITRMLPMAESYAEGLILLGLTPCAPFLPPLVRRAGGDMTRVPAIMVLSAVGTVVVLPVALPFILPELAVSAIAIARPVIGFLLFPCMVGMALLWAYPATAKAILIPVERGTHLAAIGALGLCIILYGNNFVDSLGQLAILAQVSFLVALTSLAYAGSYALNREKRAVIALALSTRNVGAALAPLLPVAGSDQRAIVMVILGIPVQMVIAAVVSAVMARHARPDG
ncbi:hypothetical protein L0V05_05465 [Tabrizicola sp. J26]|uniref:bile acid:sodium symporter family protein n=1 Tax=Alitabrizicola rongguiensis TaxID=2909234 RepID=UPI001F2227AE|nr:hypothetical protein [Tabrizicola rongguiensis]MCF1708265.1 hypothetical protein [Tabrizicola rongguiensis]